MTNLPTPMSPFDQIRHEDEQGEYWLATDLMSLLGYPRYSDFKPVIDRAIEDCEKSERDVDENFRNIPQVSGSRGPARKDYQLTAYACRLIVMASRTRDKDIASKARTYFSDKVEQAELLELAKIVADDPLSEVAQRIARRQELTDANRELIKRAEQAGVITKRQRAIFMNWGYKGLYAGETEDDIHARKELAPSQSISDWMDVVETMANVLRAIIAKRRMDTQETRTPREANYTHYLSGKTVRDFLRSEGITPEELPTPTKSYRQIVKEEAARIAEEERQEALKEAEQHGLWAQLPEESKSEHE
jgi:DNA-damage-inducible protein D